MEDGLLFTVPETPSPRVAWFRKHRVHVRRFGEMNYINNSEWLAWIGGANPTEEDSFAGANTEDEAIAQLAKINGLRLWNEEESSGMVQHLRNKNTLRCEKVSSYPTETEEGV